MLFFSCIIFPDESMSIGPLSELTNERFESLYTYLSISS